MRQRQHRATRSCGEVRGDSLRAKEEAPEGEKTKKAFVLNCNSPMPRQHAAGYRMRRPQLGCAAICSGYIQGVAVTKAGILLIETEMLLLLLLLLLLMTAAAAICGHESPALLGVIFIKMY
jgi:hypothetical protein